MWKRETKTRNASRFPLNNIRTQLRLKDEICMYRRNGDAGTLERGEDPCEAHSRVGHRLPHSPHHGMNWNLDNGQLDMFRIEYCSKSLTMLKLECLYTKAMAPEERRPKESGMISPITRIITL